MKARAAGNTPIVVVLRPPLDVESMERTAAFPTIPRAANAIAKTLRWARGRES